jgi:hypothetical protein
MTVLADLQIWGRLLRRSEEKKIAVNMQHTLRTSILGSANYCVCALLYAARIE